ncbi:arabinan endo-1,5-alpha-L-arabinosidase [Marinimicrobium sp. ABcell2]|uniref:arabinan endo-1,5-alpha-L-arabinosidase n=1 Tax=Marinimicrobium sp. ABcell2 TaxID=3069751 RepID=UPI0027AF1F7B|nr:arabinan endo-1,5-alpha-L-arabinosidase [Marinimicrobium sp. ABcell2]MDQ2075802.1 arabinan endo-1,5-alpha-L-arabinosidase [Marinimicrobium sp. ABcell2]
MKIRTRLALISTLMFSLFTLSAQAEQVSIHDPVMAKEDGTYYLFSTGPGITIYNSTDMINWRLQGRAFETEPDWARDVAPGFNGHLWAPDIIYNDEQEKYYLYYSVSAFGQNTSGIGVTTSKTLNPESDDYGWEDQGIVVQSIPNRDMWNAIDPHVIVDDEGTAWMNFGSFWGGMKMFKLNDTWTKPAEPQEWHTVAKLDRSLLLDDALAGPGEIEAPFIFKKDDYYYLFISLGKCCRGAESTYHLAVGRSENVTGPYLDKDGVDMNHEGGTVILEGNEDWYGVGHNSAYTFNGTDYLVFHAYEAADDGLQKLKIAEITWKDGWPVIDESALDTYQSRLID